MKYSIRNFFLVFLLSIVIFAAIAVFVIQYANSAAAGALVNGPGQTGEGSLTGEKPDELLPDVQTQEKGETVSFLVCGIDEMNGWADGIFLVRIDKTNSAYTLISIPANTRLYVGGADRAIGSLTALESPQFLKQKITAITGIEVDYYVAVEMQGFKDLVDLAGGVDFNVPVDMKYKDPEQALKIDLKAGQQRLNGEKALQLVRFKDYENSLEGRHEMQMEFFKAFASAVLKSANVFKAQSIVSTIFESISTDMTATDFLANASLIFSFDSFAVTTHSYPGRYVVENGVEWYVPSTDGAFTMFEIYR